MPFLDIQDRIDLEQDEIRRDYFMEGKFDAKLAQLPRYRYPAYLEGYIAGLKKLDLDPETQEIVYPIQELNSDRYEQDF